MGSECSIERQALVVLVTDRGAYSWGDANHALSSPDPSQSPVISISLKSLGSRKTLG
jgi:hypothetical protein